MISDIQWGFDTTDVSAPQLWHPKKIKSKKKKNKQKSAQT